ncbi:hypothetical protein ACOMCU_16365 [Lysinibacillus sp. UGB7]|uniref:hypothetical protein n=1 Tax=Lysinibacillus sp. UGB7 TaxID=3411039 RepID=UPI003B7ABB95
MFINIEDLKRKLAKNIGTVFTLDVKCPRCLKISRNSGNVYANDFLNMEFTSFNFYDFHHFHCKSCGCDRRYDIKDIRGFKQAGTLEDYVLEILPLNRSFEAELWSNSIENHFALVEAGKTHNKFMVQQYSDFYSRTFFLVESLLKCTPEAYYFNNCNNVIVEEVAKVIYRNSIRARKVYRITNADNTSLVGKYLELRLNPIFETYEFSRLYESSK